MKNRYDKWRKLGFKYAPAFGKGYATGEVMELFAGEDYSWVEDAEPENKEVSVVVIARTDYNMIMRALRAKEPTP